MPNTLTLTGLTELIYKARDLVANEPSGFIQGVTLNAGSEAVSLGGSVKSVVTATPVLLTSHTPAMTVPSTQDATVSNDEFTIGQVARTSIPLTGEISKQLSNIGQYEIVLQNLFAQHIRAMRNGIEAHVGSVLRLGSSRAVGTAGTTPFASNHNLIVQANEILTNNGAPEMDGMRSLVVSTGAGTNIKLLTNNFRVNESGSSDVFRRGILLDIDGVAIRQSAGVAAHTKGTLGGSPTITNANFAVGTSSLTLSAAGTGSIVAGDALSIANDTGNVYIVNTGDADVSGGGTVILNAPGLRKATGASTRALTVAADYTANILFHRAAVELVVRPPAMPLGGDAATERTTVFDPVSGLSFEVALYKGYGMNALEFCCYYQAKVWKPDFVATILG